MGMYDRVWVRCPSCGVKAEGQSKGGDCLLRDYVLGEDDIPADVLGYMVGDRFRCQGCDTEFELKVKATAYARVIK